MNGDTICIYDGEEKYEREFFESLTPSYKRGYCDWVGDAKQQGGHSMSIVKADHSNLIEWTNLALMLFPESNFEKELDFHDSVLISEKEVGLLYQKDNKFVGFMNLSIRTDYVNGTETSPVAFVEAIFILPDYRKQGIATEFIAYAENFARQNHCKQLASDCFIDNTSSEQFHKSCGFIEKERVICFAKDV